MKKEFRKKVCLMLASCSLTLWIASADSREVTILYTNDIESVYEPIEAHWREDIAFIGGMAHLSSLIRVERSARKTSFLVDAGDIFTGSLSKVTEGRLSFDLYSAMGYDAVNLGNHEFEYGWEVLSHVKQRARFPVLNANIMHEASDSHFSRQYAVLESDGVKLGVIGLMGIDAFMNTMMKSNREGLYAVPPDEIVQRLIDDIRDEVDLLVLLTHQNKTAPMQTDKEADPMVRRGIDEDFALAGKVRGVDLIVGGHSDHGLEEPVCHPVTGTCVVMTYGQGMHLGVALFSLQSGKSAELRSASLIPVDSLKYPADPSIVDLISKVRLEYPALMDKIAKLDRQAPRKYYRESVIGNLLADALRDYANVDIGMMPAGAIRADFASGDLTREAILNVFPFTDRVSVLTIPGNTLRQVLEKSLSLEYGLVQFSGLSLTYDSRNPIGKRLATVRVAEEPLDKNRQYTLVTGSFTANGGENYTMFEGLPVVISDVLVSDALIQEFGRKGDLYGPNLGRQVDLADYNK